MHFNFLISKDTWSLINSHLMIFPGNKNPPPIEHLYINAIASTGFTACISLICWSVSRLPNQVQRSLGIAQFRSFIKVFRNGWGKFLAKTRWLKNQSYSMGSFDPKHTFMQICAKRRMYCNYVSLKAIFQRFQLTYRPHIFSFI